MQTHELIQGSPEWHAYRREHFNASDAPAMLGCSQYKTRSQLLHEMATGIVPEVDAFTQKLFDDGHRFEALARKLAEDIIGDDLYPVTGSNGKYSASFDGLTLTERDNFEHKSLNDDLRAAMGEDRTGADLPKAYRVQMEQQHMVSDCDRTLFMASRWEGEKLIEERHCWYESDETLRAEIIAGWEQFDKDLCSYIVTEEPVKAQAERIKELPALVVQARGEIVASNLPLFKQAADQFIANIKTELVTDEDFATAEETVKFCDDAEKSLEHAKSAALAQTASIGELMRTVDHIQNQLRDKRLMLNKLVDKRKAEIKADILAKASAKFQEHAAELGKELSPLRIAFAQPDFPAAMKNKRTLKSLQDAVDTALANGKIAADALAKELRAKLAWYKTAAAEHEFLFSDLQSVILKATDDFQLLVNTRITNHKQAQQLASQKAQSEAALRQAQVAQYAAQQAAAPTEPAVKAYEAKVADILDAPHLIHAPEQKVQGDAEFIFLLAVTMDTDVSSLIDRLKSINYEAVLIELTVEA